MKKSLIWITAGIAAVGFGVPAFAAHGDSPGDIAPTQVTIAKAAPVTVGDDNVTTTSVDDNVTTNSVDDNVTTNSVEDISGPCDEAEHANDPRCTGASSASDDSGHDDSDDAGDSGHRGRGDDSGHRGSYDD